MKRVKVTTSAIKTRAEVERLVRETVKLQLDLEAKIVRRDRVVKRVQERANAGINTITVEIEKNLALLEQWSEVHREKEFGKAQSLKFDGHTIGWRLGNHAAKPMKGRTWADVVARLRDMRKSVRRLFLRVKIEADKVAMIKARFHPRLLARFGVQIVQSETFFLDPDREGQAEALLTGDKHEVMA